MPFCQSSICAASRARDFQEALSALLGEDALNLSLSVISGLKAQWLDAYKCWQKRGLAVRRYVYVWADGIFL
ncbi:hypothetical protein SAMN05216338_10783 [Bradyrhizobium sp. Rc2d]|nr:hypothetical protein SAMN05216338_10783 [Bradyrhizobium sp. Rc2d]